ncbi:MAG: CinA family nicotinamide mononucleotide deamidase-related protein [Chloroflexia bacterium]
MRAEIVSIGTELLLGTITDTNASFLAQRLAAIGIDCYYVSQVGDNLGRLVDTLERASGRSDLVVATGGLGPTQDDLTREAIASLLGETMTVVPALERDLRDFFERRGVQMPERNLKQATLIPSAEILPNPVGTAPGWWVSSEHEGQSSVIVAMPGVPYEMKRMWEREVEPRLRSQGSGVIVSRTLKTMGLGESAVEAKVQDLMGGSNPTLAPYAKQDGVHLRVTAKAATPEEAERLISGLEAEVRSRLGAAIYGADDETPVGVLRRLLSEAGYRYAVLEVGPAVAGSIAPLAGDPEGGESAGPGVIAMSVDSFASFRKVFGEAAALSEDLDLEGAIRTIHSITGSHVIIGLSAKLTPLEANGQLVTADVEIAVLTPDAAEGIHLTRSRHTWKTQATEIRRLAGMAAYNLTRLRLLKTRN